MNSKLFTFAMNVVFVLSLAAIALAQSANLTNDSIIEMAKVGLDPEVIIAKIKAGSCKFDTSVPALAKLKEAKVDPKVVAAMVEAESKTVARKNNAQAYEDLSIFAGAVILLIEDTQQSFEMPEAKARGKISGLFNPFSSTKIKLDLHGEEASTKTKTNHPAFDFTLQSGLRPEKYVEVYRLEVKNGNRHVVVGSFGLFTGVQTGVKDSSDKPVKFTRIQSGLVAGNQETVWRLEFTRPLESGHYAIVVSGGQYVFDFQVN